VEFSHPDTKSWMDLPNHLLRWIKVNKPEHFDETLEKLVKSGKYNQHEIDRLHLC